MTEPSDVQKRADVIAAAFGAAIRERRVAAEMTQDELALATGVGRRFLIDLEAGKASSQLGRGLMVAESLGLRLVDLIRRQEQAQIEGHPADELPAP